MEKVQMCFSDVSNVLLTRNFVNKLTELDLTSLVPTEL
jgi:hypothetical protein